MCMCTLSVCTSAHQKRALDPIIDGYEPTCGCCRIELGTAGGAAIALNFIAISPAPQIF